jgi:leader peptidase (prepilin peptidase)/N-methyltransferase
VSPFTVGLASAAGLAGGALLPLIVHRLAVASGEPVRSECAACEQVLPAGMAGWLRLPARCVECGRRLGPPFWLTGATAAVASGLIAAALGPVPALPLYLALCLLGVLLGAIDLACQRLPHLLVVPSIWLASALFIAIAAASGQWSVLLRAGLGAAALGAAFLLLFLLPGRGLGYGDVKLAVLLGLFLGWLGWREVVLGGMLPWLVNAPIVLALMLVGRVGRRTSLPFGPAMLVGALLAVLVSPWLDVLRV